MRGQCEYSGCDVRCHRKLFIDTFGAKGRYCSAHYDKRFKQVYGEPEVGDQEKPKIRIIQDLNYDYFKEVSGD